MSDANSAGGIARTERFLSATPQRVFEAFEQPEQIARWWGPDGFTNTFELFEFKPGGRWVFVMHGPNGINYPNESVFREIVPESRVVIEHVVQPLFTLTVTLTAQGDGTHLTWVQKFDDPGFLEKVMHIIGPANEQNLDRLQTVLGGGTH
ncbi:MAG: SRPBCC domain-containing protein [Planctomycetaceae bacterium]|nr:SRPBCC domain-containing protein [Planctomycetaceae bacterium]